MEKTFLQLKKNCKKPAEGLKPFRLALLGDCATQHLGTAVVGAAYDSGLAVSLYEADYDQLRAEITDPASGLYQSKAQAALLYMCSERLYEDFCRMPLAARADFAKNKMETIRAYWRTLTQGGVGAALQCNFPLLDDGVFGNFALRTPVSFPYQLTQLNAALCAAAADCPGVYLIDLAAEQARMGQAAFSDTKLYYMAKMPISMGALPPVAERICRSLCALAGMGKKCVVTDLDNTLWGGVIGDDGMEGIEIGELGAGHAFSALQQWLKELKERGVLLAVCSKNSEDTAKEPFLKHPEMLLHLEDFSMFTANWEDKAANLRHIQKTLNIGMDSLVFLDDNPFERNLVRSMIPEITVPELPEDPAGYLPYLRSLDLFETASYSEGDAARTAQYRAEAQRVEQQEKFGSYDEYLQSLDMTAEAEAFMPFDIPRIAQLTQRSNQFNLRTVRYNDAQVKAMAEDARYITRSYKLKDKFGEHGLICVVILEKQGDALFVDTWLMSCRVLKRGMEAFVVNDMLALAKAGGFARVVGEYLPTQKNAMVKDIYGEMGFTPLGEGRFAMETAGYKEKKNYIRESAL